MAKRLNKQMVLILTIASMVLTTVAMVVVIMNLPQKDPRPLAREAEVLAQEGKYDEAVKKYQGAARRAKAIKDMDLYAEYMNLAGETALKGGSATDARRCWADVMLNDPKNEAAQQHTVSLFLEFANHAGVPWNILQEEAQKLVDINPGNATGLHALGLALVQQRAADPANGDAGEKNLLAAMEIDRSNPDYSDRLARYYLEIDRVKPGFDGLKAAGEVYDRLVQAAEAGLSGEGPAATTGPETTTQPAGVAREKSPETVAKAYLLRGRFFLFKAERLENEASRAPAAQVSTLKTQATEAQAKALADLQKAVDTAPDSADALVGLARYWLSRQPAAENEQERQKELDSFRARAKDCYGKAIRSTPETFEAYQGLARIYVAEKQPEKAVALLRTRLDRGYDRRHYLADIDTLRMMNLREDCFRTNMNRLVALPQQPLTAEERNKARQTIMDELVELYNQTVADTAAGEQHPMALFMKGRLLMMEGNVNGAISKLEQAEKAFPQPPPELRQMLANTYMQTRAFGPAAEQLDRLTRELPAYTTGWIMLAQARLQSFDPSSPDHANDLNIAFAAVKEALRQDPASRDALATLARVYRAQGNEPAADEINRQLSADLQPAQLKLRDAIVLLAQAAGDQAKVAQAEGMLREALAADPINTQALGYLIQILTDKHAAAAEADKAKIAADIEKTVADTRAAAAKKLADTGASTQPSVEQERLTAVINGIDRLAILGDVKLNYEEKAAKLRKLIEEQARTHKATSTSEDAYMVAAQLFDVYRRSDKLTKEATEQANTILAMDLKPDQAGIVDQIFMFATKNQNWPLAEKCIIPASTTGLDPADGNLYRGRLHLARAGTAGQAEQAKIAREARDELRTALTKFPKSSMGQVWLGMSHVILKEYEDAKRAFEEARRLDPRNGMAVVGLAMVAEGQGDQDLLNGLLDTCQKLTPENPWVQARLAARREETNPEQAIVQREALRKQNPKDLLNLRMLASLYARTGKLDEAAKICEECQALEPANLEVAEQYAQILMSRKDFDGAEKVARKAAESIDKNNTKDRARAQILSAIVLYNKTRDPYGAIPPEQQATVDKAFVEAANICSEPDVIGSVASYFRQMGNLDKAVEWQRRAIDAIAKSGQRIDAQKERRVALMENLLAMGDRKRVPEIMKELSQFQGLFPEDPRYYALEGRTHELNGDDNKAIDSFGTYIKNLPDQPTGYALRAQTYFRASRWSEAIKDLQEVKRISPVFQGHRARLLLARALRNNNQGDAAVTELQSIVAEDPDDPQMVRQSVEDLVNIYESRDSQGATRRGATDSLLESRAQAEPLSPVWPAFRASVAINRGQVDEAVRYAAEAAEKSKGPNDELEGGRVSLFFNLCMQAQRFDDLIRFATDKLPPSQRNLPIVRLYTGSAYAGKQDAAKAVECYLDALNAENLELGLATSTILGDLRRGPLKPDDVLAAVKKRLEAVPDENAARLLALLIERAKNGSNAPPTGFQQLADSIKPDKPRDKSIVLWLKSQVALDAHMRAHNYAEARKIYEQMLQLEPRHLMALNNLAYMLMTDMKDPQAALPYSEQAAKLAPTDGSVLDTLGWNHVLLKNYDDAVSRLRQAIQLQPDLAPIHYHAAEAFHGRANADGAKSRDDDLAAAKTEVLQAYELIRRSGKDTDKIIDKVIELGGKLGLALSRPTTGPAGATTRP